MRFSDAAGHYQRHGDQERPPDPFDLCPSLSEDQRHQLRGLAVRGKFRDIDRSLGISAELIASGRKTYEQERFWYEVIALGTEHKLPALEGRFARG